MDSYLLYSYARQLIFLFSVTFFHNAVKDTMRKQHLVILSKENIQRIASLSTLFVINH